MNMKTLIPIFLLFFSVNGYCGWFKVVESDSTTTYIDDSKISKKDKFIRVWTLNNMTKPRKLDNGMTYQSYISLTEIDCREDRMRELSTTLYQDEMGKGSVLISLNEVSKWSFSPPGSVGDNLVKFSCGFK